MSFIRMNLRPFVGTSGLSYEPQGAAWSAEGSTPAGRAPASTASDPAIGPTVYHTARDVLPFSLRFLKFSFRMNLRPAV